MIQVKNSIIVVLATAFMISSCGTGKKLAASQAEADALRKKTAEQDQNINTLKTENGTLTAKNKTLTDDYTAYKTNCEATKKSYAEIQSVLTEEAQALYRLEQKLDEAMADFNEKGVEVYNKDGILYVSLSDGLLYKSGSTTLEEKGKKALGSLASALNDFPKLEVIVVGNADSILSKKGSDNWTLSTERANTVVRILRDNYKVNPYRLTAAGKGKYDPIADNRTPEGRAKNRRTDIILNPNIERLWNSVQKP